MSELTRKIIIFNEPLTGESKVTHEELLTKCGAESIEFIPLINGAICTFAEASLAAVLELSESFSIEDDYELSLRPPIVEKRYQHIKAGTQVVPYGVSRIGAYKIHDRAQGKGVRVAVLDTGIKLDHTDLAPNFRGGVNFISEDKPPVDDNGHGTHVAGIIAAADNGVGVLGVAAGVDLYAVKVLDQHGTGRISTVVKGMQWCADHSIKVINMSFGTDQPRQVLNSAIKGLTGRGIVVVSAAGNDGQNNSVDYPAAYPQVIAVGAVDLNDRLAGFSSRGPQVTVVAPGVQVLSTAISGGYQRLSGTSMATAHVTGVAALLLQFKPRLSPDRVKHYLGETAERLQGLSDDEGGSGLIRADLAVEGLTSGRYVLEPEPETEPVSPVVENDKVPPTSHRRKRHLFGN